MHTLACLGPILIPSLITQLKYLAVCSAVANVCMATGIGVVFYYALQDIPSPAERPMVGELRNLPLFFGTTIFAFEGIALVRRILDLKWLRIICDPEKIYVHRFCL